MTVTAERTLRRVLGLVGVGLLAGTVTVACEPDPWMGCPENRFCVWRDRSFGGHRRVFAPGNSQHDYLEITWPGTSNQMDNDVSSYVNRTDCIVRLWQDNDYDDSHDKSIVPPGYIQDQMQGDPNGGVGDNELSSHRITIC
jgi:hypothetical protein